jgi:hypothetical protein
VFLSERKRFELSTAVASILEQAKGSTQNNANQSPHGQLTVVPCRPFSVRFMGVSRMSDLPLDLELTG